jgi:hypothetical protein
VLAYLVATVLEYRLKRAGQPMTAARALDTLATVQTVDHTDGETVVTQMTRPSPNAAAILRAIGLTDLPRILRVQAAITPD